VTLEIGTLFVLLVWMVYLFLTEKLPIDLTAFLGLVALLFAGYLNPREAFSGFSSTAWRRLRPSRARRDLTGFWRRWCC
jgi:di/tricarboxylate transporter